MIFPDPSPRLGDSDNILLFKIAQMLDSGGSGGGVSSFNTRMGAVTLTLADVSTVADSRYVLKSGDTMTGALAIGNGTIAADAPVLSLSQTWNNAATTFTALKLSITDTASGVDSNLIDYQVGGFSVLNLTRQSVLRLIRQNEATDSGPNFISRKRGNSGDASGAILNGGALGTFQFSGWSGTAFVSGASFFAQADENWSGSANGTNLTFQVIPVGSTSAVNPLILRGTSVDIAVTARINNGTVVAVAPALEIAQTWNNAAVTFNAFTLDVTDTASTASSRLALFRVGGATRFTFAKSGDFTATGAVNSATVFSTSTITAVGQITGLGGLSIIGTSALSSNINATSTTLSFFNVLAVVKQTSGANLTNNVTAGGTNNTIANYTDLTVYQNDAAAIRNDIYQLARSLKIAHDALRIYGLLT